MVFHFSISRRIAIFNIFILFFPSSFCGSGIYVSILHKVQKILTQVLITYRNQGKIDEKYLIKYISISNKVIIFLDLV